jgi:microcystin-dependent protein
VPFTGEIRAFASGDVPTGWLPCDGRVLQVAGNTMLFSLFGTYFGGDGRTTFRIPDLRGRALLGLSDRHALGEKGGEEAHALTSVEMPAHSHQANASTLRGTTATPAGAWLASEAMYAPPNDLEPLAERSVGPAGHDQPHDNMQPFLTVNVCVCTAGVYPSR